MLGMVAEEPADFELCWRECGVVPPRTGSAIGVASEVILRETARSHPQWHQVGSRSILLQRASSALRTKAKIGVIAVLERGDLHHCFGAGGAVSSSAGRDACRCTGRECRK